MTPPQKKIGMMSDLNGHLKCFMNNINGLNSPFKRKAVMNLLIKGKFDIVALQESHIAQKHVAYLKNSKLGREFFSADARKKRGVVLYIKEKIEAELKFKDTEGRYVGVEIKMGDRMILICNIYVPNGPKTRFIKELRDQITKSEAEHIMIFGDFNGVLDPTQDKSRNTKRPKRDDSGMLPRNMLSMKEEFNLHDIWRYHNPTQRDYTFYSARHDSWSRIDMIWATSSLLTKSIEIRILPRDKSDHCPIIMNLNYKSVYHKWKLDDNLIKSEEDINRYTDITKEFFKFNIQGDTKPQIIWDTYKAVIRGHLIQLTIGKFLGGKDGLPIGKYYKKSNGRFHLKELEELKKTHTNLSWFQYAQMKEQYSKDCKIGFNETESIWDKLLRNEKKG
uniref:exodeoxyribonuclease III n=1 Tax=Anolis carolinensis TaxID=28377 RepID=A0A803TCK0_ANOCA